MSIDTFPFYKKRITIYFCYTKFIKVFKNYSDSLENEITTRPMFQNPTAVSIWNRSCEDIMRGNIKICLERAIERAFRTM